MTKIESSKNIKPEKVRRELQQHILFEKIGYLWKISLKWYIFSFRCSKLYYRTSYKCRWWHGDLKGGERLEWNLRTE